MSECKHGTPLYAHCEECRPGPVCPAPMSYEEEKRLRAELAEAQRGRDAFRAVLEGAEYPKIDNLPVLGPDNCLAIGKQVAALSKAFRADRDAAKAEAERLREAIDAIHIYADDTLSGRADGPTTREWLREGIVEIRNRARAALQEKPHG